MMKIDSNFAEASNHPLEWLETDAQGGYASSTLTNSHSRRYHGLFVPNLLKPEGRYVLLSKLEDSLLFGEKETFFTAHRYPGFLFPEEEIPLTEFTLDYFPGFTYRIGAVVVKKSIMLPAGKSSLLVRYDMDKCPKGAILRLKPFLAYRGYHELSHENAFFKNEPKRITNGFTMSLYDGMPAIYLQTSRKSDFTPSGLWYKNFQYAEEINRGFDGEEDLFLPGVIDIPVERKCTVILTVCLDQPLKNPSAAWQTETVRRGRERKTDRQRIPFKDDPDAALHLALLEAGRKFLITAPNGKPAVIAGYPWFGSWSRDTLISLPGLCFHAGRTQEGIAILKEITDHEQDGFLPNFFSAAGAPAAYNSVDSSLWYFWAVQELLNVTGDSDLIRIHFWPAMKRIIAACIRGTKFNTGIDNSGLLHAGNHDTALTWMDALVQNRPVTPRNGFPVEINALWYNALCFSRQLTDRFGEEELFDPGFIPHLRTAFLETFWNGEDNCLGDVWSEGELDCSIRPNQIFAVSLPFSPLDADEQKSVVKTVREHLLTPFGLRTLSPADSRYHRNYRGGPEERDRAYHQGTVWPWLIGAWGEAVLVAAENKDEEKENLRKYLRQFLEKHLPDAGTGGVSEVFDGDLPHCPGGCISQAWSVAELTRLYFLIGKQ
jgi:predicted glycogen debranching enzyme